MRSCGDSGSLSHCSVIFQTLKSSLMITIEAISKGKRGGEGAPEGPSLERTLALVAVCLSQNESPGSTSIARETLEKRRWEQRPMLNYQSLPQNSKCFFRYETISMRPQPGSHPSGDSPGRITCIKHWTCIFSEWRSGPFRLRQQDLPLSFSLSLYFLLTWLSERANRNLKAMIASFVGERDTH